MRILTKIVYKSYGKALLFSINIALSPKKKDNRLLCFMKIDLNELCYPSNQQSDDPM